MNVRLRAAVWAAYAQAALKALCTALWRAIKAQADRITCRALESLFCRAWGLPRPSLCHQTP